jgi:hypothetical protein
MSDIDGQPHDSERGIETAKPVDAVVSTPVVDYEDLGAWRAEMPYGSQRRLGFGGRLPVHDEDGDGSGMVTSQSNKSPKSREFEYQVPWSGIGHIIKDRRLPGLRSRPVSRLMTETTHDHPNNSGD